MNMGQARLNSCRRLYGIEHRILFKGDENEFAPMQEITRADKYLIATAASGSNRSMSAAMQYAAYFGSLVYVRLHARNLL